MPSLQLARDPGFSILLVEDDPAIIHILQQAARVSFPEANIIPITTFEEAVVYFNNLEGRGPKLILLDVFLSGTPTGLDFLKLLKAHQLGKFLPAIVVSQNDNKEHVKAAYQFGATSYFKKPFTFGEWKIFLLTIRLFWHQVATLPQTNFEKQQED